MPNEKQSQPPSPHLEEKTWEEFAEAGLFWWVNRLLHLCGWAIVREMNGDKVVRVYPAHSHFRGFTPEVESNGFKSLTKHLSDRMPDLLKDTEE